MKRIFFILMAVLAAVSLDAQNLTILHLNDSHSHVDPQRAGEYKGLGGVIEQAAYIDSVRQADGAKNVLLLHGGDIGQGTSYFTEMEGNIEIDLLNAAKYDVMTLGNHEFDNGSVELARRLNNLDADVVCANYDFTGTPLENLVKPYVIVKRAGLKIGIIGLLTDISKSVEKKLIGGLKYQDPVPVVNEYAAYLKKEKKCDLVICLSHLGYDLDQEVAAQVKNVDVIVGGHSHTQLDQMKKVKDLDGKEVVIVQDWCWGMSVGNLKVTY
ncbi:MAG: metallophosphoesterase [Bacteroidales bacterium]|nr:metallophosphoesterase [Bacteroidales bacterium]